MPLKGVGRILNLATKVFAILGVLVVVVGSVGWWLSPTQPAPQSPLVGRRLGPRSRIALAHLVREASRGQAGIERTFAGPDGLTGLVLTPSGSVAWTNGRYVFLGAVFDTKGQNLSLLAQQAISPQRFRFPTRASAGFLMGTAGPILTMVADPNCAFCHQDWIRVLGPRIAAGTLRVRVVPVALVDPATARVRAAAILSAPDPGEAWMQNERDFHEGAEQGGLPVQGITVPPVALTAVETNTAAFFASSNGTAATPTFVYHGRRHVGYLSARALHAFLLHEEVHGDSGHE
jgi:thiol:disulfide interchange protein DsbG